MKKSVRSLVLFTVLLVGAGSVQADSTPIIRGTVSGLELCQQSVCGSAIFAGLFSGQVGWNRWALGKMAVAVQHNALPEVEGDCTAITGGEWGIWAGLRHFGGSTTGELCNNGDNTFAVTVTMEFESGGTGYTTFHGTLDHTVFPPTIRGTVTQ